MHVAQALQSGVQSQYLNYQKSQGLVVGALLECHFKEQAIFPLLFARGFLPCLGGESGGHRSVDTEGIACWGVLIQEGLGISPFQCSESGGFEVLPRRASAFALRLPANPLSFITSWWLSLQTSAWIVFGFSLKLKIRTRAGKSTPWVKHCTCK